MIPIQTLWDKYGNWMQPFAARVPIMYALGDEEGEYSFNPYKVYLERLRHQEGLNGFWQPYWYSFSYGPVHVSVLSSEHDHVNGVAVWDWLESDLQKATEEENRMRTPFLVVVLHRPMYNAGATGLSTQVARNIEPLLERYRVSVVISSHCHNYERTKPMYGGQVVDNGRGSDRAPYVSDLFSAKDESETHGVIHLSLGTGGRPGDRCPTKPWTVSNTMKLFGYGSFSVTRKAMSFELMDIRGRVRDSFRVCSRPDCKNPPLLPGAESPYGSDEWLFGQECEAELAAQSSTQLSVNSLGSGCLTDVVTSVPFKALFPRDYLQNYEENRESSVMVLPGEFIADFVNNTATAAKLAASQVDLYGASSDGVSVVLSIDVIFPMGREISDIHDFVDTLMGLTNSVYTSFPADLFTIIRDDVPTDDGDAAMETNVKPVAADDTETSSVQRTVTNVDISTVTTQIKEKAEEYWHVANMTMFDLAEQMNFGHMPIVVYVFWGVIALIALASVIGALVVLVRACCCCRSSRRSPGSESSQKQLLVDSQESHDQLGDIRQMRQSTIVSHPVLLTPAATPAQTARILGSPTLSVISQVCSSPKGVLEMEPPASVCELPYDLHYVNTLNMRETCDSYQSCQSDRFRQEMYLGQSEMIPMNADPRAEGVSVLSPVKSEGDSFFDPADNRTKRLSSQDGYSMMPPAMLDTWKGVGGNQPGKH